MCSHCTTRLGGIRGCRICEFAVAVERPGCKIYGGPLGSRAQGRSEEALSVLLRRWPALALGRGRRGRHSAGSLCSADLRIGLPGRRDDGAVAGGEAISQSAAHATALGQLPCRVAIPSHTLPSRPAPCLVTRQHRWPQGIPGRLGGQFTSEHPFVVGAVSVGAVSVQPTK